MPTSPTNEVEVGERYGSLTVIEVGHRLPPTPTQAQVGSLGASAAQCSCDCGDKCQGSRLVKVWDTHLRQGYEVPAEPF